MGYALSSLVASGVVSGAIIMGNLVAGLFFLKFWTQSADRLFLSFALAFWIFAVQRVLLALFAEQPDAHVWLYLLRVLGFVVILLAIIDKNRVVRPSG
jgi:hypothetical protein